MNGKQLLQLTPEQLDKHVKRLQRELSMSKRILRGKVKEKAVYSQNESRKERIDKAMIRAKERANYQCENPNCTNKSYIAVIGSHIKRRKTSNPHYRPDDPNDILCLCQKCDSEYDSINKDILRVEWLERNGFTKQAEKLRKTSIKIKE